MKKLIYYFFAISLFLNIMLLAIIARGIELPVVEAINDIKEPGTYGPPAVEVVDEDVTINSVNVLLRNTQIKGNLYLTIDQEGIVALDRVQVQGRIIILANAQFTLTLEDCAASKIEILEGAGATTIVSRGATNVEEVEIAALVNLQEEDLENGQGFMAVKINTDKKVTLKGDFDSADILASGNVKISQGSVTFVSVQGSAGNTVLELTQEAEIGKLSAQTVMTLVGQGTIHSLELNSPGLTKLQGDIGELLLLVGGIFLEVDGNIAKLQVPELDHATSITLSENTLVSSMELNGRTGVTGQGQIDTVTINTEGVVIDQTPKKIVIPQGLVAIINGEEYKYEPKPEPKPEQPKPSVTINTISGMSLLVNGTGTRDITASPGGVALSVRSSNTNVATVSISGKRVTVTGKKSGTATITVTGTLNGYNTATRTFTVTVNAPTDVKSFEVKDGLSPGKKLVFVTLHDPNPSKYDGKVRIGNVVLSYLSDQKKFYGEVNTTDAKASNVRVD